MAAAAAVGSVRGEVHLAPVSLLVLVAIREARGARARTHAARARRRDVVRRARDAAPAAVRHVVHDVLTRRRRPAPALRLPVVADA